MLSVKTKLTNNLNPKGLLIQIHKTLNFIVFSYIHSFMCYHVIFTRKTNSALLSNVICRNESNNSINEIIFILSSNALKIVWSWFVQTVFPLHPSVLFIEMYLVFPFLPSFPFPFLLFILK
jgi:hypothetical protein